MFRTCCSFCFLRNSNGFELFKLICILLDVKGVQGMGAGDSKKRFDVFIEMFTVAGCSAG